MKQKHKIMKNANFVCIAIAVFTVSSFIACAEAKKSKNGEKPEWAKKESPYTTNNEEWLLYTAIQNEKHSFQLWCGKEQDIRDYTDADMERLLDQWEEDEEPLEDDELPEHLRPLPGIDMSKLDPGNPEGILEATKKGRTLMTFVSVSGNPSREETEELTKLWQTGLWNSHIQAERYLVDDNRAIFLFKDGSQAWTAKEYLVEQERCESVTIESKEYPGKFSGKAKREEL